MKKNCWLNLSLLITAAVVVSGSAIAADSLSMIAPLGTDTTTSARAITPDGRFVVGQSGTAVGFLYPVGGIGTINVLSSDGAQSTIVTGVGYRSSGGNTELILAGMSSGYVTEWMTADGGASFGVKRRDTTWASNVQPSYNSVGSRLGSDAYYVSSWINANGSTVYLGQGTGPWPATMNWLGKGITSTDQSRMNSVSASGRAVGWRNPSSAGRNNYMLTWTGTTPAASYFAGLDGSNKGEAAAVSANGLTVFGQSPLTIGGVTANYVYKVVNPGSSQTINGLPLFGDEAGSTSLQFPFGCAADGGVAVGMAYRGTEKAVLWNTEDPNPANWFVLDLTAVAQSEGILDGFTRLSRAYSVGRDDAGNFVIAGQGAWSPDGGVTSYTRGFVMTVVPEPGAISLLVLGGLLLIRRRN